MAVAPLVAVVALLALAACPAPGDGRPDVGTRCEAGDSWFSQDGNEAMTCDKGRWKLYRNPNPKGGE